jgi:hypothetical protein
MDDDIYEDFLNSFPEYAGKDWDGVIVEDEMKSAKGKEIWREFMMRYENKVILILICSLCVLIKDQLV